MEKRPGIARILALLVDAAETDPAKKLSMTEMAEAGWPDERILPEAAAGRVYTAIRTLRRMGIGKMLITEGGYQLDPRVVLIRR